MHSAGLLSLFVVALLSSVIPIPTELPIVELLRSGELPLYVFIVLTAGSIIGAFIGYFIGRYGLTRLRIFHFHSKETENNVRGWFQKHGEAFIIISPWIPFVGDLAPIIVGIEKYDSRKFLVVISIAKALKSAGIVYFILRILRAI
ncbi:SNARE associated Golgi protein [uncultured archaeon]|nr:SNARE associated Golgi protein [uncultured archaeon]